MAPFSFGMNQGLPLGHLLPDPRDLESASEGPHVPLRKGGLQGDVPGASEPISGWPETPAGDSPGEDQAAPSEAGA